jgi:hypothetical protein
MELPCESRINGGNVALHSAGAYLVERNLILAGFVVQILIVIAGHFTTIPTLAAWIERCFGRGNSDRVPDLCLEERVVKCVSFTSKLIPGAYCATKALAIVALLRILDYPAVVCVGLRKTPGRRFSGHAWATNAWGNPIGEPVGSTLGYLPFVLSRSYPERSKYHD